jgi:hypothetical protein
MHPLQPDEMGADFDLAEVLRYGSVPIIWRAPHKPDRLDAYAQLYLREEIQAEALVRNLPGFARFLPTAALFHGQIVNTAGLARDAGVARTTVSGYLEILQDTYLVSLLPAFEAKLRVKERRHPKLYWADPGIVRAMKRQLGEPVAEERWALLEGWVHGLLRARHAYEGLYDELAYWAPSEGATEVDFLLRRGRQFIAIEVKATAHPGREHLRGLRALARDRSADGAVRHLGAEIHVLLLDLVPYALQIVVCRAQIPDGPSPEHRTDDHLPQQPDARQVLRRPLLLVAQRPHRHQVGHRRTRYDRHGQVGQDAKAPEGVPIGGRLRREILETADSWRSPRARPFVHGNIRSNSMVGGICATPGP